MLSAIILGANLWSWAILFKQKQAWESFAKKYKMIYRKGKFLGSPEVDGMIDGYKINLYTAERRGADVRSRRLMTVLEITAPKGLVDGAAIGTAEMLNFIKSIGTLSPLVLESPKLKDGANLFARNDDAIKAFLTNARMEHINQIFSTRGVDILFIFHETQAVLRIETADPMADAVKMDKAIRRLIGHLEGLKL